jgi:hypothetical protein
VSNKTEVRRIADEIGLPNAKRRIPPASASSVSGHSASEAAHEKTHKDTAGQLSCRRSG